MGAESEGLPQGQNDVRRAEAARVIADAIELARLQPGRRYTIALIASECGVDAADARAALPELLATHPITLAGDDALIGPIAPEGMLSRFERRKELESILVRSAAARVTPAHVAVMRKADADIQRCALLGDIEGLMRAEVELEAVIVEASGRAAEGEELRAMKREFRRAWCAANRFRDVSHVARLRTLLVDAIASGDPEAAEAQVTIFFDKLRREY